MNWRRGLLITALLLPGLGLILALIGTVVYLAIAQSFGYYNLLGDSEFSTEFWTKLSGRRVYQRSIQYSLFIGVVSAILSVALAYPLAIWLRKPFTGSMTIGAILKAPMLVHGLVAAFLFINVISYNGLFNQIMQGLGIWDEPRRLQNDSAGIGVLILQVWKNMPFALLLLTGAVQSISDDVLDAARDMGAGAWSRFRKIIAPLTLSGMQAALINHLYRRVGGLQFSDHRGPDKQTIARSIDGRLQEPWRLEYRRRRGRHHDCAGPCGVRRVGAGCACRDAGET